MSKKLEKNGLWESSRMMLPEHKARIQAYNQQLDIKEQPILDPQKQEEINDRLRDAFEQRREITLLLFNIYDNESVTGVITRVDVLRKRIQIAGDWILMENVVDCA
jgi:hypothetical protein